MQPSDSQPPQKEEKVGFWAKLFGKKPKVPTVPPHASQTPPPQLGSDTEDVTKGDSMSPPTSTPPPVDTGVSEGPSAPTGVETPPVDQGTNTPGVDEQKPQ